MKIGGQVLGEKRIVAGAGHCLPSMFTVIALRAREGNESRSEFHLRILAAQSDGFLDPGVSVKTGRGIGFGFADPLLLGLDEIADVKPCQSFR